MYKQSSIALLLAVTLLGGCKTLDSVSNIVSGDSATPEQTSCGSLCSKTSQSCVRTQVNLSKVPRCFRLIQKPMR